MSKQKRYISMTTPDFKVIAFHELEDWREALDSAEDWVWQFADNPQQAIYQHESKLDEWEADSLIGTEKKTY